MRAELVEDIEGLEAHREAWDELAVGCARPYCAPAWMLAWWRHARPPGARLRAVLVWDGERLAGVAPFHAGAEQAGRPLLQVAAAELSGRVGPLAGPADQEAVAPAVAAALADAGPAILRFDQLDAAQPWADLLMDNGRGGGWRHGEAPIPAPTLALAPRDVDAWHGSKSRNFRQKLKQRRRRLAEAGAVVRVSGVDDVERDVRALLGLHAGRWEHRGGSGALVPGIEEMLVDAGRQLVGQHRFRLHVIEADGAVLCAQLFVAAGGEVAFWNGGFDESWAAHGPALVSVVEAVEEGLRAGDARLDFGAGGQEYKYRLAEEEDLLRSWLLVPPGRGYTAARVRLAPYQAHWALRRRVSPERRQSLKRLLRRG